MRRPRWLPSLALIGELFPASSGLERLRVAATNVAYWLARAAWHRTARRVGPRRLGRLLDLHGAEALLTAAEARRPTVLVAWHAGLVPALGSALVRLGVDALVLRYDEAPGTPGITYVSTRDARARALYRAVRHARAGGVVVLVLNATPKPPPPSADALPMLGRAVDVPRGAAAIARLAAADIRCIAPHLGARGPAIEVSAPLCRAADDAGTMRAIVAWWDDWLRAHPGALWPESARAIARYPRI